MLSQLVEDYRKEDEENDYCSDASPCQGSPHFGMPLSSPCSTNIGLQLTSNPGEYWRARDIIFMKEKPDPLNQPYVVWDIAGEPSTDQDQESSALIRSEVLFPLA